MKLNWRFYSFYVLPPHGGGEFAGKKREVEVYCPFPDAAHFAAGAAKDETLIENRISDSDRAFRARLCKKSPSSEELVDFYSGLQRCLRLGVPIRKALETVIPLARTPYFRGVIGGIYQRLVEGDNLATAMKYFPEVFDQSTISLIQAGEHTGDLRPIFADIATVNIRANTLKKKIVSGFMYPGFILVLTLGAVVILGWKVIPEIAKSYKGMNITLPAMTRGIVWCSDMMRFYPWILLIPVIGAYMVWSNWASILKQPWMQKLMVVIPLFGPVIRGAILVKTLRSLALLLKAGVTSKDSFEIVAEASGHEMYAAYFRAIGQRALAGEQLPAAFLRERARIPVEGYLVAAYAEIGAFVQDYSGVLRQYADILDEDVQTKAESLPRMIEPVLIVFLTVVVGGIVAAVYMPYFTMLLEMMKQH